MSDYELWAMFNESGQAAELFLTNFLALLFGFLVASYFIGAKLDRTMATIVLALYSVMALRYAFVYLFTSDDVIALADELRTRALEPESSFSWLQIGPVHIIFTGVFVVMLLCYIASVYFFIHHRRKHGGNGDIPGAIA